MELTRNDNIIERFVDKIVKRYNDYKDNSKSTHLYKMIIYIDYTPLGNTKLLYVEKILPKIYSFGDNKKIKKYHTKKNNNIIKTNTSNISKKNRISIHKNRNQSNVKKTKKIRKIRKNRNINKGLTSFTEWNNFCREYSLELKNKYIKLKKYCDDYYKKHNKQPNIHISIDKINIKKFRKRKGSYSNDLLSYNPNGLWFSCGTAWIDWIYSDVNLKNVKDIYNNYYYKNTDNTYNKKYIGMIGIRWYPINIYILDLTKLNMKRIKTCRSIKKFSRNYKTKKPRNIGKYIKWDLVKRKYDGLRICPYQGQCGYYKEIENIYYNNTTKALSNSLLGKVSHKDIPHLWHSNWETDSGVVWKNFKKIKIEMLE